MGMQNSQYVGALYNKGVLYTDSNFKRLPKSNAYENVLGHNWASSKDFSGTK